MAFKTIHTQYGLSRLAQAETTGTPINLVAMAVGDGNGQAVTPTEGQTDLVRERFRAAINRVYQDPVEAERFTAELVVPATEGGFTMREVGVYDDQGGLFVVGNLPDTYKPNDSEGAYADTVVRVEFLVTNAEVITLQVDPNIAVATQTWVSNNVTASALIPGGTTGQVLAKSSNADGDTEWVDPNTANVVVDIIEESQELADGQTQVDLVATTTLGLVVYLDGQRLAQGSGADEWQPDASINTRLHLGQTYPAGTELIAVQNEPAGSIGNPLQRDQNLADIGDAAAARQNLGVYSKEQADQKAPPGAVIHFARQTAPIGWLKANGAAVSRTAYASLFAAIGTTFGAGDGFNTFNLPDLRGEFIRGWDDGRGIDDGRTFGSWQADQLKQHDHGGRTGGGGGHNHGYKDSYYIESQGYAQGADGYFTVSSRRGPSGSDTDNTHIFYMNRHTEWQPDHDHPIAQDGGNESRPRNRALLACIKY